MQTKIIGSTGYAGTLNGRATCGCLKRSTNNATPVSRKKNQKTGAVKSTMNFTPLLLTAASSTSARLIAPVTR